MSKTKLSATMLCLVEYMRAHGREIHRHPGGFWAKKEWRGRESPSFGTLSVEAIVSRGVAEYTEWRQSRRGPRFPIVARLTERT